VFRGLNRCTSTVINVVRVIRINELYALTLLISRLSHGALFDSTHRTTAIAIDCIAIVTGLTGINATVAAGFNAAITTTAITVVNIAIITLLTGLNDAVTATGDRATHHIAGHSIWWVTLFLWVNDAVAA
jgi:hypothetical protein